MNGKKTSSLLLGHILPIAAGHVLELLAGIDALTDADGLEVGAPQLLEESVVVAEQFF